MNKWYNILFLFFLFLVSFNLNGQTIAYDTTRYTMCEDSYFYNSRFDTVRLDSLKVVFYDNVTNHAIMGIDSIFIPAPIPGGIVKDSVFILIINFNPTYNDTIYASICKGQTYSQFDFNESQEGIYTKSLRTINNCDSIVSLNLIVNPTYLFDTIFDTTCDNTPYNQYGLNVDTTGVYTARLQTINGCDSIYIVNLKVNPTYTDTIKADIYSGNVYNKFGFNEKETGIYEQKLQTILGCDSIIYLDLQVDNIMFPNVVTPNGDGINDVFEIHNLIKQDAFPENELTIYTRQGKLVYRIKNISKKADQWDPNKTSSPSGTYYFCFKGKRYDKTLEYVGAIEVLR